MTVRLSVLDNIKVASPCHVPWDSMKGDDRVRFCDQCRLSVYNLSAMSRADAESLIERTGGRLCARYFRRADGTVITTDCPVGVARLRARLAGIAARAAAAVVALMTTLTLAMGRSRPEVTLENMEPFQTLCRWVRPEPVMKAQPPVMGELVGKITPTRSNP